MSNKEKRVALYASDLAPFTTGTSQSNYNLYNLIKAEYNVPKQVRLTTFHVATYYNKTRAEIEEVIFGVDTPNKATSEPSEG